ncbi:hypothetical protein LBMAG18_02230 [Alphaproteobacteria bacterium]|nr:hypothetical protein LBMAG18_02230 [Alphaproteobacteria bacterium]
MKIFFTNFCDKIKIVSNTPNKKQLNIKVKIRVDAVNGRGLKSISIVCRLLTIKITKIINKLKRIRLRKKLKNFLI